MKQEKNEFIIINENKLDNVNENKLDYEKEYIVLLDYKLYSKKIYKSYNENYDNIFVQFNNDYSRCIFKINDNIENNIEIFLDYFEFLLHQKNKNIYKFLMLCTQASMGCPLELLYKSINNINIYIGELKKSSNLVFNIKCKNIINIEITKTLRLFCVENGIDKTLKIVKIKIYIPFNTKEKIIIVYKILKNI
jgi:hypothetical protein